MSRGDIYMVVTADGLELPCFIATSLKEVSEFLNITSQHASAAIKRHSPIYKQYRIEKISTDEDRLKSPYWVMVQKKDKSFEPRLVGSQEYEMLCMQSKADLKKYPTRESCEKACFRRNGK